MKGYQLAFGSLIVALLILFAVLQREQAARYPAPVSITVSAASNVTEAFREIGDAFEAATGIQIVFNMGATGQLAEQIRQGASVDVFAAADVASVGRLEDDGLIIPETKTLYARGRITLWVPADSPLHIERLEDLADPAIERIAVANPEYAPYGMAAKEALEAAGVWHVVSSKLLLGANVAQALSYAQAGEVDVAILPLALSLPSEGRWVIVPSELHRPLDQALAVVSDSDHEAAARAFATYVVGPEGRAIMQRYGFTLSGEEPSAAQ